MTLIRRVTTLTLVAAFTAGMLLSVGCTKYANPDDLKRLEEAKQAAISAEKELDKVRVEHKQVEKELADKQKELQAVQADLAKVQAP